MMGQPHERSHDGLSKGVKVVITAMVLIIILPATIMSLPLSKLVVTIYNQDDSRSVTVTAYINGADNGYFNFVLAAGGESTVTCSVSAGTHDINVHYWYADDPYYGNSIRDSYTLWPFETEEVRIGLHAYYYS